MKTTLLLLIALLMPLTEGYAKDTHGRNGRKGRSEAHHVVRTDKQSPKHGTSVRALPRDHVTVTVSGHKYYRHNGHYYKRNHKRYVVVRAPINVHIRTLPHGHRRISVGPQSYFYFGGAFYWWNPSLQVYVSVGAPVGAIVPVLVPGYRMIHVSGRPYYVVDSDYYVYDSEYDGYRVVPPPRGHKMYLQESEYRDR